MGLIRLAVDHEFPSRSWWENGGEALWEAIAEGFDGPVVVLDEDLAQSWLDQARAIAGWDAGPEYAPHPIAVSATDEEEEHLV